MKRIAPFVLVLAAACGGGGDGPVAPAPVASVSISSPVTSMNVGETATLGATPRDAQGNALTGRTITWTSSNAAVASVTSAGVVTAASAGATIITATAESKSAQAPITVTAAGPSCTGVTPLSMSVGDVRTLSAGERALLCVPGGAAGAEYALVPVNTGTASGTLAVEALSSNTQATSGPPTAVATAASAMSAFGTAQPVGAPNFLLSGAAQPDARPRRDVRFEQSLRDRERAMRRTARRVPGGVPRSQALAALRSRTLQPQALRVGRVGGPAAIKDLPATPALGSLVTLNASATSACQTSLARVARVAAVTANAIVVVDTTAPNGGFSDTDYLSFATTFDTLVFPLDTAAFGAPYDMDGNGRVLLFFTTAVNQLSAPNSGSVVGGFFFERDLVPVVANAIVPFNCPTSNEGEMFYLPVVDVDSRYNGYFKNKDALFVDVNSTLVHEFQHLINASHRYYITPEIVESEESWLNEGMSHVAEELLYFRAARFSPKADLKYSTIAATQALVNAINAYQVDNLSRFSDYLRATDLGSPYADNDDLSTRGAGWALLRYALDQSPNAQNSYLHALVSAPTQGIPNFNNVFASIGGLAGAMRDFAVANFTDNSALNVATRHTHPSWDFRDLLSHLPSNSNKYPLSTRTIVSGVPQSFSLARGSSAYLRFRVGAGGVGAVRTTSSGASLSASVELLLVRTQ